MVCLLFHGREADHCAGTLTVVCPTASSYLQTANMSAGAVVEMAAIRKTSKYQELAAQYTFKPIALKSLGSMDSDTQDSLVISGGESPDSPR